MSNDPEQVPSDGESAQAEPKPAIERVFHEKFARLYSNSVQMGLTPWDIQFTFGEVAGKDEEKNQIIIAELAKVTMSPQHAKAFLVVFTKHLKRWEEEHGTIGVPADLE